MITPVFLLALCIGQANAMGGDSYVIDPPAGWQVRKAQGDLVMIAMSQDSAKARMTPGGFFLENVLMTREKIDSAGISEIKKAGMADYIQGGQAKFLKDAKPGFKKTRSFNGVPGALTQLGFKNSHGTPLCNTQFSFLDGNFLYTIVLTRPASDPGASLRLAEKIFSTLSKD
jgi:hypothetical protein